MIKASTAPYAALLLRVSLGIMFLAHVGLKVFVFTIPGFVGYFGSLGLPAILAYALMPSSRSNSSVALPSSLASTLRWSRCL